MKARSLCLTQAQANELQDAYRHCQDADTKIRFQAVRLYGTAYSVAQIKDICGCGRRTLLYWTRAYQQHGLTALLDHRLGGNRARLTPAQIETVQNQLHRDTPAALLGREGCVGDGQFWTIPDVARLLERDYGVTYQSRTSYQTLMQKCGLSYQRPSKQYKSHSEAKLMDFEEALEKKIDGHRPGIHPCFAGRAGHGHSGC
jgi:transposase